MPVTTLIESAMPIVIAFQEVPVALQPVGAMQSAPSGLYAVLAKMAANQIAASVRRLGVSARRMFVTTSVTTCSYKYHQQLSVR